MINNLNMYNLKIKQKNNTIIERNFECIDSYGVMELEYIDFDYNEYLINWFDEDDTLGYIYVIINDVDGIKKYINNNICLLELYNNQINNGGLIIYYENDDDIFVEVLDYKINKYGLPKEGCYYQNEDN